MSDLYLKALAVGPMANLAYLVGSRAARACYAVDPAWDVQAILDAAAADGMTVKGALVTHFHPDHCGGHLWGHDIEGVAELATQASVPVYAHADEIDGIVTVTGLSRADIKPMRSGDRLEIGGVAVTGIHTPGHTPGSQCFLCGDHLISGDTLFLSGCGRVDLPGGSADQLFESLSGTLAKLPDQTIVHPGHTYDPEPEMALGAVKRRNPYLGAASRAAFRQLMGQPG